MAQSTSRGSDLRTDYARIRKSMPPPEQVEADRRRLLEDLAAEREIEEVLAERREQRAKTAHEEDRGP